MEKKSEKSLTIIYKSVNDLQGYKSNSRTHSDEQILQIANSINEFGFTNPILIQKNQIIAGHGRLAAAKSIGLDSIPTIELKSLTADQVKALVIADNQLALNAGWDLDILKSEIDELKLAEFDIDLLGFDDDFLDGLLECEVVDGLTDEDEVPEPPADPVTVLGDIWTLGNHRLMCGDSTSIDAADLLLEGITADMVHTDPPYGVSYQANKRTKSEKFDVLENDDKILDIAAVIDSCSKGWVFVWTSWKVLTKWLDQFESFGYPSNQVIWFKGGGGIGDLKKTFSSDYETALVWHRGSELTGKRIGSVWKVGKDGAASYLHPTQKPVALAEEAIDKTTRQNAIVLDLFGGSGSTLIACEKTNRKSRVMELDPKYCDVIIKRWEEFTGKDAIHIDTGKTYKELANVSEVE